MTDRYSVLVLRGTQIHRFVVSNKGLRHLLLAGVATLIAGAAIVSDYLAAQNRKVAHVIANGQAQREKLIVLRDSAREVEKTLAHWKALRARIRASLPEKLKATPRTQQEADDLEHFLGALQAEIEQMIESVPSAWPINGTVVSGVGMRPSPWTGRIEYHAGLDIPKPIGTPVRASGEAVVESIDTQRGTIILNHGQEIKTHYAHLSRIDVREGEHVRKGQEIAAVGNRGKSTGPHLHYEVRVGGTAIDPRQYLIEAKRERQRQH